jgi:dipeptidyl-peptidase-4
MYHGAIDDNVHLQNAFEFATALQKHNKTFDLMIYPQDRHGIGRGDRHLRALRLEYIERYLCGDGIAGDAASE